MMLERRVDAAPLCRQALVLFANAHNAWGHLYKHVLDAQESWNWGVLIPPLQAALSAGRRADLYAKARAGSPEGVPAELEPIWNAFLDLVAAAVETGTDLGWYWEEKPKPGDGPYRTFAASGVQGVLDEERVRTGFLPCKERLQAGGATDKDRRYQLFFACWKKIRQVVQRLRQDGRFLRAPAAFQDLMRKVIDRPAWEELP